MDFFQLKVIDIVKEAKRSKSFILAIPKNLQQTFAWQAGQHVNIKLALGNKSCVRSYSISNDNLVQGLRLTIKSVELGIVSNYFLDKVKVGQYLTISRPMGRFVLPFPQQESSAQLPANQYIFFAAGSGITPIYAMVTELLTKQPLAKVTLLYSNRKKGDVIFHQSLTDLAKRYSDRFTFALCLTKPSWFARKSLYHIGRIDNGLIKRFLTEQNIKTLPAHYFICGPSGFMETVQQALRQYQVNDERIHLESFGGNRRSPKVNNGVVAQLIVEQGGRQQVVDVKANQTLLSAMLAANYDAPYSCEEGVCGSCQCQLESGDIEMVENLFLTEEEQAKGLILTCQAVAKSSKVRIKL